MIKSFLKMKKITLKKARSKNDLETLIGMIFYLTDHSLVEKNGVFKAFLGHKITKNTPVVQ